MPWIQTFSFVHTGCLAEICLGDAEQALTAKNAACRSPMHEKNRQPKLPANFCHTRCNIIHYYISVCAGGGGNVYSVTNQLVYASIYFLLFQGFNLVYLQHQSKKD